jgi:hypothetical protein
MPHVLLVIRSLIAASLRTDRDLVLENVALRQQLALYKARYPRPSVADADRLFWIALSRWWPLWRDALTIVSPETVLRWHRRGFKAYWRRKSERGAPPSIPVETRETIRRLHKENVTWGAPRIHGELLRLDFNVSEATVSRYLARLGPRKPKQHPNETWVTFLRNHAPEFSAMDFFTVYDIFFQRHYVFFVLDHGCRKIRHFAVTTQPTGAWVLQQLREAFPYDAGPIRRLICDSDPLFTRDVLDVISGVGIKVYQFRGKPWMNGHAERFVGAARADLFNHVIVLNESHLRRLMTAYVSYHHDDRTHISLGKATPANRDVEKPGPGAELIAEQRLGGLHHRYRWSVRNAA